MTNWFFGHNITKMADERAEHYYSKEVPVEIKRQFRSKTMMEELTKGTCMLSCGHIMDAEGFQVRVASILKITPDQQGFTGWAYQFRITPEDNNDKYEYDGFHRIDGQGAPKARLPDTFFHMVAEVDEVLIEEQSEQRVKEIMSWVLELGHDLPKGVLEDVTPAQTA